MQWTSRFCQVVFVASCNEYLSLPHKTKNYTTMQCLVMQAMADQGSGGAFEISQRMTAMIGWGATTGFAEKWVFDQAADTYALDQDMADKLRK